MTGAAAAVPPHHGHHGITMTLADDDARNADQIAYWNGPAGQRWLERQRWLDEMLAPASEVLLERAAPRAGEVVLDIGCGGGTTSVELARRVAPGGRVVGVDVSQPLLGRARELGQGLPIEFSLGDATTHPFEPGRADLLFSRFGVMFFADPVRAFVNMRRGLRAGARLAFACWRHPRENPWAMVPLIEAYKHVPRMPELGPEDPGPFSFAAEQRVRRILEQAGFAAVQLDPVDLRLDLAGGRGLDAAVEAALNTGPASRALDGQPAELRAATADSMRAALAARQVGDTVPLAAAIWIVQAVSG
jgi:SAM-dependent methyltransferase